MKVCIIDYGSGNLNSIKNILNYLEIDNFVTNNDNDIINSSHIILPGVGSYSNVINKLKENCNLDVLKNEVLIKKKPFLGICVGMQILSEFGNENKKTNGLGWIKGQCKKINTSLRLPHIGWNSINIENSNPILKNIENQEYFYFVHSYFFETTIKENVLTTTNYGHDFPSSVVKENIYGVQFHPEKSQQAGIKLIKNFINIKD